MGVNWTAFRDAVSEDAVWGGLCPKGQVIRERLEHLVAAARTRRNQRSAAGQSGTGDKDAPGTEEWVTLAVALGDHRDAQEAAKAQAAGAKAGKAARAAAAGRAGEDAALRRQGESAAAAAAQKKARRSGATEDDVDPLDVDGELPGPRGKRARGRDPGLALGDAVSDIAAAMAGAGEADLKKLEIKNAHRASEAEKEREHQLAMQAASLKANLEQARMVQEGQAQLFKGLFETLAAKRGV